MAGRKSRWLKLVAWIAIVSHLNLTSGCYYYTYSTESAPSADKLDKLKNSPNYIVVHRADQAFHLNNVRVDQQAHTISGNLGALSADHEQYLETKPFAGSANRYKKKGDNATPNVVHEVHLYLTEAALVEGQLVTLPVSSIEKVEVYDPDTGATTASFIFGGLGITAGAIALIGLVILLTKSSCPFVYVNNGEDYVFAGEIYSGAIFRSIERNDYLMLPPPATSRSLEIKIANKLKEIQYINDVGVLQVSHPVSTIVRPDRRGNVHHIRHLEPPERATAGDLNITALLRRQDSTYFSFNRETEENFFNDLVLIFPKPARAREAHLLLNAKSSLWGDYVFGEFTKLFGHRYSSWIQKQNLKTVTNSRSWAVDQGLAMKVYVQNNGRWQLADTVDLVGPLAFRDMVVPLNLAGHDEDTVRIKLSAGFMLWDLDYAAVDYSDDTGITVSMVDPVSAITNAGGDALALLHHSDDQYLVQKQVGDEVIITFPAPAEQLPQTQISFILHARGYYQHLRSYSNPPAIPTLLSFRNEGRFSRFSKEKYDEFNQLLHAADISASIK